MESCVVVKVAVRVAYGSIQPFQEDVGRIEFSVVVVCRHAAGGRDCCLDIGQKGFESGR